MMMTRIYKAFLVQDEKLQASIPITVMILLVYPCISAEEERARNELRATRKAHSHHQCSARAAQNI